MLTVRLNDEEEKKLTDYCERNGISKSDVVKEALIEYFKKETTTSTPYDLGHDLFGRDGNGNKDDSRSYKKQLKEKLRAKHPH